MSKNTNACEEWPGSLLCPIDADDSEFLDWMNMNMTRHQIHKYSKGERPFFLAYGAHRPHLPWNVPRRFWDHYAPTSDIRLPEHEVAPTDMPYVAFTFELDGKAEIQALNRTFPTPFPNASSALPHNMTRTLRRAYYAAVSWFDCVVG